MKYSDFFDRVESHPKLKGLGVGDSCFIVAADVGGGLKTRVDLQAVKNSTWEELERVLLGGEIHVLRHMSRVVGYYSFTENWNISMIGELKDRQKGKYAITNPA